MIKLIIEKELREIVGSVRFAVTFGICSTLILLSFYVGAKNYRVSMSQYEAANVRTFVGWRAHRLVQRAGISRIPSASTFGVAGNGDFNRH